MDKLTVVYTAKAQSEFAQQLVADRLDSAWRQWDWVEVPSRVSCCCYVSSQHLTVELDKDETQQGWEVVWWQRGSSS